MVEVYPGIEHTAVFSTLRRCMEERNAVQMENEFEFRDGSKGWFELRFEPVPEGVAILSVDITDRMRAEVALRRTVRTLSTLSRCNQTLVRAEEEHQFLEDVCRILVESGGYRMAWIGLLDSEKRIRPVTSAGIAEGHSSKALATLSATPWSVALADRALQSRHFELANFEASDAEFSSWQQDTAARDFTSGIAFPLGDGPACLGVLTICAAEPDAFDDAERALLAEVALDLGYGIQSLRARSAQAKTRAELDEAHARIRVIHDHLPQGTLVWRHAMGRFTLIDMNDVARAAATAEGSEVLGCSVEMFGFVPHLEEDLLRCSNEGTVLRREVDCTLPGTSAPRRIDLTYGPIPPCMVLMQARDVTEQRRTEQQLIRAQRLEAVGQLAGGLAHDFNNLLMVILSHAEFASDRLDDSDPIQQDLEQVRIAGQRAATLTRQLLAFSRKQPLEPRVTNVNHVVEGLENMLRRLLGQHISIDVRTASDLGNVMADPAQLEQVIMNLAVNARDAMPEGGKLTIETANLDLDETQVEQHVSVEPGPYVRLSVADNGMGMTAETRSRIFEPFFTTKGKDHGTGLGLSMVYGIVKQSRGSICVHSEPSQGAKFVIYLPRVGAPADPATPDLPTRPATAAAGNETILIVEDEDGVRRVAERMLHPRGYRVLAAANGTEALRQCDEHSGQIDLLLTDVVMPEMSGRELAARLAKLSPGLKVLFMSGYADDTIVRQDMLNPGSRFLGKPFSREDLLRKVRQVLDEE
jgi:signal transduction histidine kinase/ActR/RegA family two-component response regulator